jgi:16S rRNA (adenine1518-N6/adenine1519-N6)-dimethyltransferase
VGRGAFHPAPRVDSAVIGWRFSHADIANETQFVNIVRRAFQQRRKQLRNSLSGLNLGPIDPERRPETLTPEEFLQITAAN